MGFNLEFKGLISNKNVINAVPIATVSFVLN